MARRSLDAWRRREEDPPADPVTDLSRLAADIAALLRDLRDAHELRDGHSAALRAAHNEIQRLKAENIQLRNQFRELQATVLPSYAAIQSATEEGEEADLAGVAWFAADHERMPARAEVTGAPA